jgi:CubicO group peptidase (beta-lactamase class C family)
MAPPLDTVARWPVGSAAAGVVRRTGTGVVRRTGTGGVRQTGAGPGTLGVETVEETGDRDTPYPWASVTKLLVALAVLLATEEGTLGLDDPAGPPGSTVRHLLAHASGLGPDSPRPLTAPGRRRIYSNIGFEVLADTLAHHSGMPFTDYLAQGVVLPLDMTRTELPPGSSPASGARGPLRDLLVLAGELLVPRLVSPSSMAIATAVAFPGLAGVLPGFGRFDPCDWGLGLEIRDGKAPHWTGARNSPGTFGHFGQSGGFLWVDPEAEVACAALSDTSFGPWAVTAWPALADAVIERWAATSPAPGSLDPGAPEALA